MKVTQPFPNFIQGVSQQPDALRMPSQCEELINGFAQAEEGLTKRPPTEYVAKLSTTSQFAKLHPFNKSTNEQGYVVLPGDGTISVKGFDGSTATVTMNAPGDYINGSATPDNDFEVITIADYTFIVNRTVTPALLSSTYFDKDTVANGYGSTLVWVRTPQLDIPYTITLTGGTSGVTATYNPGTTSSDAETTNIATQLKTLIDTHGSPAFSASTLGSVININRSGNDYDIDVTDGLGNTAMVLIQKAVQSVGDLPPNAPSRFQVEVTGDGSTDWDNFWLEWNATKKAWMECPAPGRQYQIDPATMPHILRYVSPGQYSFERVAWDDCGAGDTTTNPVPSFIGKAINDIFFYRGRLGFITDSTVILSEAGSIYNFWRTTVTSLVDSDPIDVKVTMEDPAALRWAVTFDDTVFFFSAQQQYYIEKDVPVLSPSTIAIRSPTSYEVDITAQPVVVGDRIYYTRQRSINSSLHDFYPKADAEGKLTYGSDEVTAHAPRYIAGTVRRLIGNAQGDAVIMLVLDGSPHAYMFQTAFNANGRTQAAIHRWEFDASNIPLSVTSNGQSLYFLMYRSDGTHIERCDLSPKDADPGLPIKLLLDQRFDETQCTKSFDSGTNKTTITLPVADSNPSNAYVMYGRSMVSTLAKAGQAIPVTMVASTPNVQFTVAGDWTSGSAQFYVGKPYMHELTLSKIVLRDRTTGAPMTGGRLQIGRIFINYGDTGYFRAVVTPKERNDYMYPLTGYQIGSSQTLIGAIPVLSGSFKFAVMSKSDTVTVKIQNDSPFPSKLLNGDWEGQWGSQAVQTARRI